jgi:hypothetical protein
MFEGRNSSQARAGSLISALRRIIRPGSAASTRQKSRASPTRISSESDAFHDKAAEESIDDAPHLQMSNPYKAALLVHPVCCANSTSAFSRGINERRRGVFVAGRPAEPDC